ncbi:Hypothetical protein, putative [Bodo saltans]|uniref:Uncharacterized protein n=1 Tax=Bodo saltans TaxID=75058 RepID=A0A0S4J6U5_BODSA|nr:Hypothetical protein, putative [Bodo saltans]|eukprot:CUG86175.1 Hypothetical protein, putative [Bodo saltans]
MHTTSRGSARPQWRLSNTIVANSSTAVVHHQSSSPVPPMMTPAGAQTTQGGHLPVRGQQQQMVSPSSSRDGGGGGPPPSTLSTSSQLAELVPDDDDTLPLPPPLPPHHVSQHHHHHHYYGTNHVTHTVASALPDLRPSTTSFSRLAVDFPHPGASPVLPGEQGPSAPQPVHVMNSHHHRRHTVSAGGGEQPGPSPRPPSTVLYRNPPSRLDRTIDRLSSRSAMSGGGGGSASPRLHTASTRTPIPSMISSYQSGGGDRHWSGDTTLHKQLQQEEARLEEIRLAANAIAPSTTPRFLPLSTKQALQYLQHSIRTLVTAKGSADMGSVPNLLLTTYNIVCKQVFHDTAVVVHTHEAEVAQQPRSLFDAFAHGGEDTTIATELRDLQRELLLTKKHYHVAIQQIDIFKHRLTEHVNEIRRLEKALDHANAVELDLRGSVSELKQTIVTKGMEVSELKSNIVALHSSMHDAQRSDHSKISERTADLRHELVSLYEQVRQSEEMTKSYEREISNLNGDVQRIESRFEDSQHSLAEAHAALAAREDELYEVKLKGIDQAKKMAALEVNIEDLLVVQGDTMLQDKMIRENHLWSDYKDSIIAAERLRKIEDATIPTHIKFIRGFGVEESVPLWLRGEGKIKAKFLNKADTIHMALQALTDISLPASVAGNMRAILSRTNTSGGGVVGSTGGGTFGGLTTSFRLGGSPSLLPQQRGGAGRGVVGGVSSSRDDAALGSIGLPSGPLGGFGPSRRSIVSSTGGGGSTTDLSVDITSRLPFSDAFKLWLSRTGTDNLNNKQGTELAYGFHHSMHRWSQDPDMILFNAILCSDVPPEIHYHCYRTLDDLLNVFIAADRGNVQRGGTEIPSHHTTVARVLKKAVQLLPAAYATEQDAEQLLFLLTLDFNIPYVPYRSLFDYDEEGGRNHFLKEYFTLVVTRTLEYYNTMQDIVERLGNEALLLRRGGGDDGGDNDADHPVTTTGAPSNTGGGGLRKASHATTTSIDASEIDGQSDRSHSVEHDADSISRASGDGGVAYPGHGNPTRPVPHPLRHVPISLEAFGVMWVREDPGVADNIVEMLSLLRMTMIANETKKKAEEAAAALQAAQQQLAANKGSRSARSFVAPPPRRGAPPVNPKPMVDAPEVDAPPRDEFTVELLVTAIRQLCITRSSHNMLPMTMKSPSTKPFAGSALSLMTTGGAVLAGPTTVESPANMMKSLSFDIAATPPTQGEDKGDGDDDDVSEIDGDGPLSVTMAPRRASSDHHQLPAALAADSNGLGVSTEFAGVRRASATTTSFGGIGLLPSMSMVAAYPPPLPPAPIEPRFDLALAVQTYHNTASTPAGNRLLFGASATPGMTSFRELGSVATHSLAGGASALGVAHSRSRLQALSKRTQTVLPPFFKARLLRH